MWDDEAGYDFDDPKHPTFADRAYEAADHARKAARESGESGVPATVTFEADGKEHVALIGPPVARAQLTTDQMTRTVNGVEYAIYITLGQGGFAARRIVNAATAGVRAPLDGEG
jgi:hypothetical protein